MRFTPKADPHSLSQMDAFMESGEMVPTTKLIEQLHTLGIRSGDTLVVHTSFRAIRPVEGSVEGFIGAIRTVLGADGTLVMPSMSSQDDKLFDPTITDCSDLGVVADTFWRLSEVLRSHSHHAFAATGQYAEVITAPHPPDIPHGLESPIGRVYTLNGKILLLGVGHDANTTIHLAESLAGVRYRRKKHVMISVNGQPTRLEYREIDHCCERFALVGEWLKEKGWQQQGIVGHGTAILCKSQNVVQVVLEHLRTDALVFLHPPGIDAECDEARGSVSGSKPWAM